MGLPVVNSSAKIYSQMMTIDWEIGGNYTVPSDIKIYIVVV